MRGEMGMELVDGSWSVEVEGWTASVLSVERPRAGSASETAELACLLELACSEAILLVGSREERALRLRSSSAPLAIAWDSSEGREEQVSVDSCQASTQ